MNSKKHRCFKLFFVICLLVILTAAFFSPETRAQTQYSALNAYPSLTFNQPDGVFHESANSSKLYVTEQMGVIKVFSNNKNVTSTATLLDIQDRVLYGGEQGLLGLAFHPDFTQNRYCYVNYVADNPRRTVIARFTIPADTPEVADIASEMVVLEIEQPYANHKGGQLAFGSDGHLYIGVGDGGSEGDPQGNGQNLRNLLGKILRIDVDAASGGRNYGIPNDNPYAGNNQSFREEIYAYGFRNPWRFSFDSAAGKLWVGDVGQSRLEEIDVVEKGKNYGWNLMEGTLPYSAPAGGNLVGLELPVWNYTHDQGTAVVGGYVYHGSTLPGLEGAYIYGDYGSGRIWALTINGATVSNQLLANTGLNIASFGVDAQDELLFAAYDGKIYSLTSSVIPEYPLATGLGVIVALAVFLVLLFTIRRSGKLNHPKAALGRQHAAESHSKR